MPKWITIPAMDYPPTPTQQEPVPEAKDIDQPGWKYADALCRSLKGQAEPFTSKFREYWDFLLGKGHWNAAITQAARMLGGWSFRGVVNDLYAVVDTKTALITGAPAQVTIEPVGEGTTELQRLEIKSVIEDEMKRVSFDRVKKDCYQWGSATGLGVAMWSAKPDALTGEMALSLSALNPGEVFCDSDCFETANVWIWYPLLKMSEIRRMWGSKADKVEPDTQGSGTTGTTVKSQNNDDNLIYGSAGEYTNTHEGIKERKARCAFVWIKDPDSIIEELQKNVIKEATKGLKCVSCGYTFEEGNPDEPCSICGGDVQEVNIPEQVEMSKVIKRAYPYGRLIVISGKTLIYDGENPYEIEEVFPGAAYHHYRVPGNLYGFGDVALLRSLQEETNTTIGQVIDYVRLAVNGPFIYPVSFKSITQLGNGPAERHPGPDSAPWLPQFVSPNGFNVAAASLCLQSLEHHFITVAGLGDLSGPSSPVVSATEAEITASRTSSRMKGHSAEFGGMFLSRLGSIQWQMMRQYYGNRNVQMKLAPTAVESVEIQMQDLPMNVRVRVELSIEEAQMDKLQKQVLQGFISNGGLDHPDSDILLTTFGLSPSLVKELMSRKALREEIGVPQAPPPVMGEPAGISPEPMQPMGGM